ncbi:MAG: Ferric-anguibactin receptor FatA [Paracidovorax wautersii]|uniref:Ferric-anguibactin receptor FatA n=1 Tax=Paracidovorax wautersii TaxID=1177982 RepID=A0A7V8FQP8_9BURK|nr:MAG: Ferric-anguibactin receptor FatA [Paracidovorax wautersii]
MSTFPPAGRTWVAPWLLATVLAAAVQPALAQDAPVAIAIAAQPLAGALNELARQAGLELGFPAERVAGRLAPAVAGQLTVRQALDQLLAGSGLEAVVDGRSVTVRPAPAPGARTATLSEVVVSAGDQSVNLLPAPYAGGEVAKGVRLGVLGNTSNFKAPFSTTSYTAQAIRDQQAGTIAEAVNRDPSVRYTVLPGGNVDNLSIRGFPIWEGNSGEIAFDGIYGIAPNYRVRTEYVDRIEVVKGPGALLFGMSPNGSVGGVINIAPKRANADVTSLTTTYTSNGQLGAHVDVGRRLGEDDRLGIRVNTSAYGGDTAVDHQSIKGRVGALALDYEGERFRATLDLLSQYEKIDGTSRPIMPSAAFGMPAAPAGNLNVTQDWEWSRNEEQAVLLRTEFDLTGQVSLFANAGTSSAKVARVFDSAPRLTNAAGDTAITPTYALFDVQRTTFDGGLRSRFVTGPVRHAVTLQAAVYREDFHRALNPGTTVASNIYDPVAYPRQDIARPSSVPRISDNRNTSVALVDTLSLFEEALQVSVGLRRQNIQSTNYNALSTGGSNTYDESVTTPALGVVVQPVRGWSLYANYIEGLSKGDVAPPAARNYGEVMAPYKSKQYEVGTKYDFGAFMATASLFQITKPSGGIADGLYSVNGEQRNRGLELYAYGEAVPGVRLLGGVTLLDAELTRSATAGVAGNRPIGVPRWMANLGAQWDLPFVPGLTVLGDLVYTGHQYVNQTNTLRVPAWTRVDVGLHYRTKIAGRTTTLRGTVQNLANRAYWAGVTSWGAVSAAIPRTYIVSATVDF